MRRVLAYILVLNIIVAVLKAVFGLLAGSMSMVADALHSSFDSVSNIVGIVSTKLAEKSPDWEHPYGHGKFETLGTLVIGALILVTACWVIVEGAGRLLNPVIPEITTITVFVMCVTIVINIGVALYEKKIGEELGSALLIADSKHTQSDVFVSVSVLAGFFVVNAGFPQADPVIAFVIGALIGRMGIGIIKQSGAVLADARLVDYEEEVGQIVMQIPGVLGYHDFRCRGRPDELFGDIHIEVDPHITILAAHEIGENARKSLIANLDGMKDIIVHVDPEGARD